MKEMKTQWKERIKLSNRYNYDVFLLQEKENEYLLKGEDNALCCVCVNYDKIPTNIISVDPSGGPYIAVGSVIDGKEVESITSTNNGFKVKFKK